MTVLAYRFALDPTLAQERALRSHAGAARVAFNLRRDWNAAEDEVAPWWGECSKEAFNTGLDQLARALKNWGDSRNGKRKGKPVGFPRFKSKRRARPSVRFTTGAFRCEARHAVLPRIGRVKLHENGRRLADLAAAGTARVQSVTVRFERGRWFVSFTVETEVSRPAPRLPDAVVGASVGRAQGRVADQRKDGLHKLTTRLASEFGTVVIEDLHVAGMLRNRRLARHVADASFGEFRRQAEYKAAWHGGLVIVADRWFASSRTCSGCGAVKAKLPLSERFYSCASGGLVLGRDVNAARNLAEYGNRLIAGSGPEIANGRGADRETGHARQVAVKRQPGTARAGQTGTVAPQGEAAA